MNPLVVLKDSYVFSTTIFRLINVVWKESRDNFQSIMESLLLFRSLIINAYDSLIAWFLLRFSFGNDWGYSDIYLLFRLLYYIFKIIVSEIDFEILLFFKEFPTSIFCFLCQIISMGCHITVKHLIRNEWILTNAICLIKSEFREIIYGLIGACQLRIHEIPTQNGEIWVTTSIYLLRWIKIRCKARVVVGSMVYKWIFVTSFTHLYYEQIRCTRNSWKLWSITCVFIF